MDQHQHFMEKALKEAQKAYDKGEAPVGAVIVKDGKIIARGHNLREWFQDPCAHAEIIVLRKAAKKLGTWRLNDCDLYVTLEPCAMCAGAIIHARIRKAYVGTPDPKAGACGSVVSLLDVEKFNHKTALQMGLMEGPCSAILKRFFQMLRDRKKLEA